MTDPIQEPTINVGTKTYKISNLPDDLRDLIAIYQVWEGELNVQRREVFKLEGAIRSLSSELEMRFKQFEAQDSLPQEPGPDLE